MQNRFPGVFQSKVIGADPNQERRSFVTQPISNSSSQGFPSDRALIVLIAATGGGGKGKGGRRQGGEEQRGSRGGGVGGRGGERRKVPRDDRRRAGQVEEEEWERRRDREASGFLGAGEERCGEFTSNRCRCSQ